MAHALTLVVILLVAAPLARFIPLTTLAAILFVVAYNMSEWRELFVVLLDRLLGSVVAPSFRV